MDSMRRDHSAVVQVSSELAAEQIRVRGILTSLEMDGWTRKLSLPARKQLHGEGHFPAYSHELDWTAREVAGHLRDSAKIFTGRIQAIQTGTAPVLADFVTNDPSRLDEYRTRPVTDLLTQLNSAQTQLQAAMASVTTEQLDLVGHHEVDGKLSLSDVLDFLPQHQRDHANQLEALAAEGAASRC